MRTRIIYFDIDDEEQQFDFGTYALIMYYAKQVDITNAKLLFDATLTEYYYRVSYGISIGSLTDDDVNAHFDVVELQQVTSFIDNKLIPALNNESQDLLVKYGGVDNFYNLFYINKDFLEGIDIDINEFYFGDPKQIIFNLNQFKAFLQYSISANRAYKVTVG